LDQEGSNLQGGQRSRHDLDLYGGQKENIVAEGSKEKSSSLNATGEKVSRKLVRRRGEIKPIGDR